MVLYVNGKKIEHDMLADYAEDFAAAGIVVGQGVVIGADAVIGSGARIGRGAVIGHHAVIGQDVWIWRGAVIGHHAVIGQDVWIWPGARIGCDAVVGQDARIWPGAVVKAEKSSHEEKMDPNKQIENAPLDAIDRAIHDLTDIISNINELTNMIGHTSDHRWKQKEGK